MSDHQIARRTILTASALSYMRILGANDRIQTGVVGCGGRGRFVMQRFQKNPGAAVAAVCDVWGTRVDQAITAAPGARGFAEHEKLLEMKELDAVLITTPDHWHCPIAIDAMKAGKDVYVEKPLTLRMDEGTAVIQTVEETKRICQVGTQRRSSKTFQRVKSEYFDSGKLGKITMMRSWWYNNPVHVMPAPPKLKNKPANLNWERFLGQVKWRPWDPQQFWVYRAYLDYGGGMITDLFCHYIDMVHYLLNQTAPLAGVSAGGVYHFKDGRTSPDTIHCSLEYPGEFVASFDGTLAPGYTATGGEFFGTKGRIVFTRPGYEFTSGEKGAQMIFWKEDEDPVQNHVDNFLDCMRSRKTPNADVNVGNMSAMASHVVTAAYTQKKRMTFNAKKAEVLPA